MRRLTAPHPDRRKASAAFRAVSDAAEKGRSGDLWSLYGDTDFAILHSPFPEIMKMD